MADRVDWKEPLLGRWINRLCRYCERSEVIVVVPLCAGLPYEGLVPPPTVTIRWICRWCRSSEEAAA